MWLTVYALSPGQALWALVAFILACAFAPFLLRRRR